MDSGPRVANARRRMTRRVGTSEPNSCIATENQSLCVGLVIANHTIIRSANNTVSTIPNISSFSQLGTEMDLMPAMLSSAMESLPVWAFKRGHAEAMPLFFFRGTAEPAQL